jgi:hypothetical protein
MSNGPTLVKDEKFQPRKYYNLKLSPRDWCIHNKGPCDIYFNIGEVYCWACKYREPLDIPKLLVERGS